MPEATGQIRSLGLRLSAPRWTCIAWNKKPRLGVNLRCDH